MDNLHLIKQYAETGAILPGYQIGKLSPALQKTYLRRRILQAKENNYYRLNHNELEYLDLGAQQNYFIETSFEAPVNIWEGFSTEFKRLYIDKKIHRFLRDDLQPHGRTINFRELRFASKEKLDELREIHLKYEVQRNRYLQDWEYWLIDYDFLMEHKAMVKRVYMHPENLDPKLRKPWAFLKVSFGERLGADDLLVLDDKTITKCFNYLVDNHLLTVYNMALHDVPSESRKYYAQKVIEKINIENAFFNLNPEMHLLETDSYNQWAQALVELNKRLNGK